MKEPENQGLVNDIPVLYDLMALALQTDSTRIATLEIAGGFEAAVLGGWLLASGERRGRYYVLGPALLRTPAQGEIVSPSS